MVPCLSVDQVLLANQLHHPRFSRARRWLVRWVMSVTTQNLIVVDVRTADNLIMVRGAVPGPKNGVVMIRKGIKA